MTFALSAKVAHIVVQLIYLNIVFSQTIGPIELKFHVKTTYDKSAKIYTKYFGHMTKMAATPIYGRALGNAELRVLVRTFFSLGRMIFARREFRVRMFF